MSTLKLFAATILASLATTPVSAQAVIQEPGYCAFFYPTANCQNKGPGNPYTDPNYRRNGGQSSGQWPDATNPTTAPKKTRRSSNASARM